MLHDEGVRVKICNFSLYDVKDLGYDASRMASHRDLSWCLFSSTSTSQTCQPPSPESVRMLMI